MAVCRSCAAELPGGARFCPACGASVSARDGEERKVVTVLFADLVDSTAQADRRDPEDVRAVVRPQLMRIRDELERHGGTFEKYVGDAVMAVFGAPVVHEDDAERAVRAALAIRDAIEGVRVAVNTGEAVVTLSAASGAGEGIATGDVVNTAFRIEEAAGNDTVLVGEPTYRATNGAIEYGERSLVQAKGKGEPVPVYEALRARYELEPSPPTPPLAPLVGRHHELSLIIETLARAKRDSTVQLVTLVGVPGIGKSRLVWELQRALEQDPGLVTWRRGRCLPYGEGVTYWALGEMVKAQAEVLLSDDAKTTHEKLGRAVRDLVADPAEADWVEGHLRPLLSLEGAAPAARRDEAFAAWRRLFEALAAWGPLVLVFEDLHWADEGLLDFIEHLADWVTGMPLVLICTARPGLHDRRPGWGGRPNAATISLPPLSEEETGQLVGFLLKQSLIPRELKLALLARAEGNPLYAEEFIRILIERSLLYRQDGGWQLSAGDLPVPESVQGIITARLDALPPEEKQVLRDAAVVGRAFWPGAASAVSGVNRGTVEKILRALERKELVRRVAASAIAAELQYSFHHALIRDGAYGLIPRAERARKHCLAAEWIESLGRPEDHSETIAHHYLQAIEYARATSQDRSLFAARARGALREAGERALGLNAHPAAARFYEAALELSTDDDPERPGLLFCYGKALSRTAAPDEGVLKEARDSLLAAADLERAAECEVIMGELLWRGGHREDAFERLEAGVQMLERRPPSFSKAYGLSTLSRFRIAADESEAAIPLARAAMEIADELRLDELRAHALNTVGVARATKGDRDGLADLERSIAIAEEANSPESIRGYFNLGSMAANLGDLRRAAELHAEGRRLAARFGAAAWTEWLEAEQVYERYWAGDWDAALGLAGQLVERAGAGASRRLELDGCLVRGWIALARGDLESAMGDADRALDFSREAGDPQNLYPALALRARVLVTSNRRTEAATCADELLRLMQERPSLPSFWVVDLAIVLGELGRGSELAEVSGRTPATRWLDVASAYVSGELGRAADICAEIGALPEESYARVGAAAAALTDGRREEAEAQLAAAIEFYRRAGAPFYRQEAEALLAG
jgi:class 3 adenylate cyclase/tetratricopeptide (TPR) repeat protein